MNLLTHTPKPNANENFFGYILRLSESNGYETPKIIFEIAQMNRRRFSTNIPLKPLTEILGKPADYLDIICLQIESNGISQLQILGHRFDKRLRIKTIDVRKAWFCPDCVKEKGYIDAFWGLRMAVACPVHHSLPLMACPACNKPIAWVRRGLLTCKCGGHLDQLSTTNIDPIILDLTQIIYAKLHRQDLSTRENPFGFPIHEINQLSIPSLLGMLERLSAYNSTYPINDATLHPELHPAKFAAEALRDWPSGYHQLLMRHHENRPTGKLVSFKQQFHCFYTFMFKLNHWYSEQCDFLLKEFDRFGAKQLDAGRSSPDPVKYVDQLYEGRYISFSAYWKRCKTTAAILEQNIANGQVIVKHIGSGKGSIRLIDLDLTKELIIPRDPTGKYIAAAHLGLPVDVLVYLREIGIYKQTLGRIRDGQLMWYWDTLDAFLDEHLKPIKLVTQNDPLVTCETICTFASAMRRRHFNLAMRNQFAKAVFDGHIRIAGRIEGNFEGLLLDKAQVINFIELLFFENEPEGYSLYKTTELTGLENMVLGSAIKLGLLEKYYRKGWPRITKSSLNSFNSNYITLKFLAIKLDFNARRLGILCRENQITLISLNFAMTQTGSQLVLPRSFELQVSKLVKEYKRNNEILLVDLSVIPNDHKPLSTSIISNAALEFTGE